ncbi:MAG: hypothetical protein ACRCXD_03780 [Luteolibacter sp.]
MAIFSHQRTILLVALVGGVLIWNYHRKPDHAPPPAAPASLPQAATAPIPATPVETLAPATAAVPAAPAGLAPSPSAVPVPAVIPPTSTQVLPGSSTDVPAAVEAISEDLSAVDSAIRNFQAVLGENPIGSNAEITAALLGNNLKQIKLGVPTGSQVNGDGQMCDRWGTPYFFHQVSATQMEIRSAGPDRQMWTGDDSQM